MAAVSSEIQELIEGNKTSAFGIYIADKNITNEFDFYYVTKKYGKIEGLTLRLNSAIDWLSRYSLINQFAYELYDIFSFHNIQVIKQSLERHEMIYYDKQGLTYESPYTQSTDFWKMKTTPLFVEPDGKKQFVYLMKNLRNGLYKIGRSKNPYIREKTLQSEEPEVQLITFRNAPPKAETELHRKYADKRIRGEWFELSLDEVKTAEKHLLKYCN